MFRHYTLTTFECKKCCLVFSETDQRAAIDHVRQVHYDGRRIFPVSALKEHLEDNLIVVVEELENILKSYFPMAVN